MFDTLFIFLFKYPLLVFQQGRFAFGANRSMWLTATIVAAGALYALWTYRQVAALQGRDRVVLLGADDRAQLDPHLARQCDEVVEQD